MDLRRVFSKVTSEFDNIDFTLKDNSTSDRYDFTADIVSEDNFTGSALLKVTMYSSGSIHVIFTFDEIEETPRVHALLNDFNETTSWAKGYLSHINDKLFFEVHYANSVDVDEVQAFEFIRFALNDLLSDAVLEHLKKITRLTF
ncbi:MAG: hypothetical protein MJ228_03450 [Bacilli bacterium]|nr:hypothetical protein [Bacilli bacterium]